MLDELITEARGWLADCGLPNARAVVTSDVIRTVHKFYAGGWPEFVTSGCNPLDDPTDIKAAVWLLMVWEFNLDFANAMFPE